MKNSFVHVKVPATSANMGPGFDCMGFAIDLWNELIVAKNDTFAINIIGEGTNELPLDESNLLYQSFKLIFDEYNQPIPVCSFMLINNIPISRGLGSSSATIIAGLLAGMCMLNGEIDYDKIYQLGCKLEGHPDNIAPALYGGIQIGLYDSEKWHHSSVNLPSHLKCIIIIPDFQVSTKDSRNKIPENISIQDAVFNISRATLFINSLWSNNLDYLKIAMKDKLHQPIRGNTENGKHLFPLIDTSMENEALACFLSGSGSSVVVLTVDNEENIMAKLKTKKNEINLKAKIILRKPVLIGAHIIKK